LRIKNRNGDFVVVETKKGKESDKVVGQIQRYMGWVKRNLQCGMFHQRIPHQKSLNMPDIEDRKQGGKQNEYC
jgi:RecB family endonuclease NucS